MRVLNRRDVGVPPGARYVGRGSPWGNPYRISATCSRELALHRFEVYARKRLIVEPDWLQPLRGYDLVCYCDPLPCHGHIIKRLLEELYGDQR